MWSGNIKSRTSRGKGDGSWVVTGAHDGVGKELPAINGRGFELVQKKNGRWRFIATREMVVFSGKEP